MLYSLPLVGHWASYSYVACSSSNVHTKRTLIVHLDLRFPVPEFAWLLAHLFADFLPCLNTGIRAKCPLPSLCFRRSLPYALLGFFFLLPGG